FARSSELRRGLQAGGASLEGPMFEGDFSAEIPESASRLVAMADEVDHPLWWEVDEKSQSVVRVRVPVAGRVAGIEDVGEIWVVHLEPSQLPRTLAKANPQAETLLARLREAEASRASVLLMETDEHEIGDVAPAGEDDDRPFDGPPPGEALEEIVPAPLPLPRVEQIFQKLQAAGCGPRPSGTTCIPFMYPDDGCWGRAHEMCRLIKAEGVEPQKAWVYGSLRTATRNNPSCAVQWGYHVAALLPVDKAGDYVLDPSMFDTPVPVAKWVSQQNGAMAEFRATGGDVFFRPKSGSNLEYDPNFAKTKTVLNTYRLKQVERVMQKGPPPYQCP
ncbi:MAG TPA: protein-glutamine glutaminase family protein, partial [Allosphingosinicella sp.]